MKKIIFIILCTFIGVTGCAKKSEINKNTTAENNTTVTTSQVEKENEDKLKEEIIETFIHYAPYVGFPRVLNAIFVAKEIFTDRK